MNISTVYIYNKYQIDRQVALIIDRNIFRIMRKLTMNFNIQNVRGIPQIFGVNPVSERKTLRSST